MKHTASKALRALCGMAVMLVLVASIAVIPAYALSNGIYIATATPHYKHPTTGKIEDSGGENSKVLGQSMTESALYNKALVEVDPQGNTYITVRLKLMDNIQNPQFQIDSARNGSFSPVSASIMQEDYSANTADFRIKVPNENVILRCNMYVVPMGRDVIFYITVSGLQNGSGDFITSVKVEPVTTDPPVTEPPATDPPVTNPPVTNPPETSKTPETTQTPETSKPAETTTEPDTTAPDTTAPETTEEPSTTAPETEPSTTTKDNEPKGLAEFDANGNEVKETSAEEENGKTSPVVWIVCCVVVAAVLGGCVFALVRKSKKG